MGGCCLGPTVDRGPGQHGCIAVALDSQDDKPMTKAELKKMEKEAFAEMKKLKEEAGKVC